MHRSFVGSRPLRERLRCLRMTSSVALAVLGVVQDGVDVVEDVPLGDGGVVVAGAELFERPIGDVLAAMGAVFGVGVEGEDLRRPAATSRHGIRSTWCTRNGI